MTTFVTVAVVLPLGGRGVLEYPVEQAKWLILLIETAATISIAAVLIKLFEAIISPRVLREGGERRNDGAFAVRAGRRHAVLHGVAGADRPAPPVAKIMAWNVMGTGVFLVLVALAARGGTGSFDPVPHALVLTGIVVAVSGTAVAIKLALHVHDRTGRTTLPDGDGKTDP